VISSDTRERARRERGRVEDAVARASHRGGAMTRGDVERLREIRRGEDSDEIELIDSGGDVTILCAYGVNAEERARMREVAMRLLSAGPGR